MLRYSKVEEDSEEIEGSEEIDAAKIDMNEDAEKETEEIKGEE